jgi:hypothetical protein
VVPRTVRTNLRGNSRDRSGSRRRSAQRRTFGLAPSRASSMAPALTPSSAAFARSSRMPIATSASTATMIRLISCSFGSALSRASSIACGSTPTFCACFRSSRTFIACSCSRLMVDIACVFARSATRRGKVGTPFPWSQLTAQAWTGTAEIPRVFQPRPAE